MSFENQRVRVTGTSRASLNGQAGTAVTYDGDTGRWHVQMDNGQVKSLKPVNLEFIGANGSDDDTPPPYGAGMGGGMPGMGGIPGLGNLPIPPHMKQQVAEMSRAINVALMQLAQKLPPGVTPKHAGYGVLAIFAVSMYFLGFIKGLMLMMLVGTGLALFVTPILGNGDARSKLTRLGVMASNRITSAIGHRYQVTPTQGLTAVGLVVMIVLYWIFSSSSAAGAAAGGAGGAKSLSEAYYLGYQDGQEGVTYGTSFDVGTPSAPSASGGGFGMGSMVTLALLGSQVYGLGKTPVGGWSPQTAIVNAKALPTYRMVIMGLMALRLFGLSPI